MATLKDGDQPKVSQLELLLIHALIKLVLNAIPNIEKEILTPFDFIVVTTKNIADVPPTVAEIITPAVTPGHTSIMLLQNGLGIEKALLAAFPKNVILSGISLIGATETQPGHILHDDRDRLVVCNFPSNF
jgi:ketopantoate reductase